MVESISSNEASPKREQYDAARTGAALVDRSGRGKLTVSGRDRRSFLHALLTNDIEALSAGSGCYAAYLTPQGRLIADMRVLELGDVILLDVHPDVKDALLQKLDRLIFSEDVQLADVTHQFAQVGVRGAASPSVVAASLGNPDDRERLSAFLDYQNERRTFQDQSLVLVRDDEYGTPGFDLYLDRSVAESLRDSLVRHGATTVSEEIWEALRVEAGRPAFHVDMDEETIPLEAGLEHRAISLTKGCYVGQEVIIRVLHRGHGRIAKKLVGLAIEGSAGASPGDKIAVAGHPDGRVTSAVLSPLMGGPIALGYVHREAATPGTSVTILHGDEPLGARVVDLPFKAALRPDGPAGR